MGEALLALLERLILSPVAQQAAWDVLKPHLMSGTPIDHATLATATREADKTDKEAEILLTQA